MSTRANQMMELLKSALLLEFPTFVQTPAFVSGDPVLTLAADATPASQEEVAYLKIVQKTYAGFPTPSLASTEDGRTHVIQLAIENETALATQVCWTGIHYSQLIARLKDLNCEIELYIKAAAAVPVEADIASGNYVGSIRADIRHPNAGN